MKLILLLTALFCCVSYADTINLMDGSIINGTIEKVYENKIIVSTDFAGEIIVSMDQVKDFESKKVMVVQGKYEDREIVTKVVTQTEEVNSRTVAKPKVVGMQWAEGVDAPESQPTVRKEWKTIATLGYMEKSGNTTETITNADVVATLADDYDILKIYARYEYQTTDHERTDDEVILGVDYESLFNEKGSWYVRAEAEKDAFEDIDLRLIMAVGHGHYFIKTDQVSLRTRTGLFYRDESYKSGRDSTGNWGPDLGINFDYKSKRNWSWYTKFTFTPSIEDISDELAEHESALVVPVGLTNFALKMGVRHEYNNTPSEGKERLDTTYFTNLQINF